MKQLESKGPDKPTSALTKAGAKHGAARRQQGYTQSMLVDDTRVLDSVIYDVVQNNLLDVELSYLIPDLSRVNHGLDTHLQESLRAFDSEQAA